MPFYTGWRRIKSLIVGVKPAALRSENASPARCTTLRLVKLVSRQSFCLSKGGGGGGQALRIDSLPPEANDVQIPTNAITVYLKCFTPKQIEDFSKDCPGTRYGASPARNDCDVCVSRLKCHLFSILESQPSITVVFLAFPMDARGVIHYPTIGFPLASELRKYWLVALRRDEGANSRVSESTVPCICSERFLRKNFTFLLVPKSLWTLPLPIMPKQGKLVASWKHMQCHRRCAIGNFFLFCDRNLKSPCAGLQWNERGLRSRERHGPERKCAVDSRWPNDETPLYRKLAEHDRKRLQRKRSKVREPSADRAANTRCRPTRSVHSNRIAEKVKQYLSGCVPVDEKHGA